SIKEMIDQLLINAEKHGFDFEKDSVKTVKFHITKNNLKGLFTIEYSNNGKDFTLTLEDLINPFQKGSKSNGTGIGGNYIYRIIRAHKGDIELNNKIKKGLGLRIEIP